MATPRSEPYVWVTWITRLMTGEAHCEWAAWFRAHHRYDRMPGDFDLATWTARHTTMLRERAGALEREGYRVTLENQNAFKLTGQGGTVLSGKPDIVAVRGEEARVIDCKTGTPRLSDQFQVLVYMLVLPHTHADCRDHALTGEVCYGRDVVTVPPARVSQELRDLFRRTMHRVGGAEELPRVPSAEECRFCDIGRADCPQRVGAGPVELRTSLF